MGLLECAIYLIYPSLLGWLFNAVAVYFPAAFTFVYYLAPIFLFVGWFWAGKRYACRISNPVIGILIGNSIGILSIAVYLWQEYITTNKINWLQQAAQYFSASLTPLTVSVVAQFSPTVDGVTQVSNTALQLLGFILVVMAFIGGYFYQRNKTKLEQKETRKL
jgi:hypothetical protein